MKGAMEKPPTNAELDLLAKLAGRQQVFLGDVEDLRAHVANEAAVLRRAIEAANARLALLGIAVPELIDVLKS